jgi:hypothetical protein
MMSWCSAWKAPHVGRVARHQGRADVLRELQDRELFRVFAQRLRAVEDLRAFAPGLTQQMGGVEVLAVEGRVLAHQHRADVLQRQGPLTALLEPVGVGAARQRDVAHLRGHAARRAASAGPGLAGEQRVAA